MHADLTVTRRVNAERLAVFGWTRAILLQFAHPLVAAGVFAHSGFRDSGAAAVRRLHGTIGAMLSLTFGDPADRERALEGIRAIHRRVHGRLDQAVGPFPAGTRYSAEDPALVVWVHATLLESMPLMYDLLVAPLTAADRDAFCRAAAPLAVQLGAREEDVPRSAAATRAYLSRMYDSGAILVGPQARELAQALLAPPFGSVAAPFVELNRLLGVGLLPPALRRQYGFLWTVQDERALGRAVVAIRTVRGWLPDAAAQWGAARRPRH
jgi:uncharacterized protein (DUF2236 family)